MVFTLSYYLFVRLQNNYLHHELMSWSSSLDALKSWIARHTSVVAQRQILMTARGKQVRLQTLLNEVIIQRDSCDRECLSLDRRKYLSMTDNTSPLQLRNLCDMGRRILPFHQSSHHLTLLIPWLTIMIYKHGRTYSRREERGRWRSWESVNQ